MTPAQLATAVVTVLVAAMLGGVLTFQRGPARRWAYAVLCACAFASIGAWTNYGKFQDVLVDASAPDAGAARRKVRKHQPFHFHEFVHYYVGAKYFEELGYLGLYDCIALGDRENAEEDGVQPRIAGWVRNLDDVLTDKTYERALEDCRKERLPRFSPSRWASFKSDLRELTRLVEDGAWPSVVYDAGFNPPPSLVVLSRAVTNLIPIRAGQTSTYLLATSLDLALLVACLFAVGTTFGRTTAATCAIYFGASYVSHFSWNVGSVLRFTWLAAIIFALAAMKRRRYGLAGVFLGVATCDRVFPLAFAAFAMVPIAAAAIESRADRAILRRFGGAFFATVVVLVAVSCVVFDPSAWRVFFSRIGHHGDIHYVMHIGLKKVLTYRDWVPSQNFHGHGGLVAFRSWNLRLHETWASMRAVTLPIQALLGAGAIAASLRRRPYEAALIGGVTFMFVFNLPANYYYVVLALVPALLLRGAATTPARGRRYRDYAAFATYNAFWMITLVAPSLSPDGIVHNFYICASLLAFLVVWIAVWTEPAALAELKRARVLFARRR